MTAAPSAFNFGLLIGLSFFLGLAFEDFFAHTGGRRPGGVRTFPLLALAGGLLYLFEPTHLVPFTGGLVVLGAWLTVYYRVHIRERDEAGEDLHVESQVRRAPVERLFGWRQQIDQERDESALVEFFRHPAIAPAETEIAAAVGEHDEPARRRGVDR